MKSASYDIGQLIARRRRFELGYAILGNRAMQWREQRFIEALEALAELEPA